MRQPIIRPIRKSDNPYVKEIVRAVFVELGAPKVGTAYEDTALECMYETYQKDRAAYFVVEIENRLIGSAGIAPLDNYEGNVCELQKMYFLPEARGRGIGKKMMDLCLRTAREFKFDQCYLETFDFMKPAQKLYAATGFKYIDKPLGGTGHYACPVHMLKEL